MSRHDCLFLCFTRTLTTSTLRTTEGINTFLPASCASMYIINTLPHQGQNKHANRLKTTWSDVSIPDSFKICGSTHKHHRRRTTTHLRVFLWTKNQTKTSVSSFSLVSLSPDQQVALPWKHQCLNLWWSLSAGSESRLFTWLCKVNIHTGHFIRFTCFSSQVVDRKVKVEFLFQLEFRSDENWSCSWK